MNIGQEILKNLKKEISESEYKHYIQHLVYDVKNSTHEVALFYVPNALVLNWIKNRYTEKIAHLFEIKTNSKVVVKITLKNLVDKTKKQKVVEVKQGNSLLNPSHSFSNFMVGGSNQFAYSAVKSISEKPGVLYNPCLLYTSPSPRDPHVSRMPSSA